MVQAAVGGVHESVTVGHPGCAHQWGRVAGVQMQLVAGPTDLLALGVALRAAITGGGDLLEHLLQALPLLAGQGRFLGRRRRVIALRPTPCATPAWLPERAFPVESSSLSGGIWGAGRSRPGITVPSRLRCPTSSSPRSFLDQGFMRLLGQTQFGNFLESGRRWLRTASACAAENRSCAAGRGRSPDARAGRSCSSDPAPPWPRTRSPTRRARGAGGQFLRQCRQQFVLNQHPALQDQVVSDSIHRAVAMIMALQAPHARKAARPRDSSLLDGKNPFGSGLLREALWLSHLEICIETYEHCLPGGSSAATFSPRQRTANL